MTTELEHVDPRNPDARVIARAAACLRRGGLVAFPTETVYGLGVDALDRDAVRRLFEAKGRPSNDPLIVHVSSIEEAGALVIAVPAIARALAARFWPGPLTLVLPRSSLVPDEVTAGLETVAIRVPSHPVARAIIAAAGRPIAAPSANLFSRPSPTQGAHVLDDLGGRIEMIVDGGPTEVGVESTVLDLSRNNPIVLRPGAVTLEMLRPYVPGVRYRTGPTDDEVAQTSPGMLSKHYAPRAPLTLFSGDPLAVREAMVTMAHALAAAGQRVGVMATAADARALGEIGVVLALVSGDAGAEETMVAVASRLYAALRELDTARVDVILACEPAGADGLGGAIRDRLRRAAAHVVRVG
ncbi:MAG: L-threonylcarbamoyladenylate synthase [Vicinamibacterales bacterium]